ncbi:unnamed protein product [Urochloa humidicola]
MPKKAGLKRCGKSCRLRWLNYLRPLRVTTLPAAASGGAGRRRRRARAVAIPTVKIEMYTIDDFLAQGRAPREPTAASAQGTACTPACRAPRRSLVAAHGALSSAFSASGVDSGEWGKKQGQEARGIIVTSSVILTDLLLYCDVDGT